MQLIFVLLLLCLSQVCVHSYKYARLSLCTDVVGESCYFIMVAFPVGNRECFS